MKTTPPYYPNPEGTECAQCVLRMGLEYFEGVAPSIEELYRLTGKSPGKLTWQMRGYVEIKRRGYEQIIHDPLDYAAFAQNPERYIRTISAQATADVLIEQSNLAAAADDARLLAAPDAPIILRKNYTLEDLRSWLDQGYLASTWIDEAVNRGVADEYWPHAILIYDYDETGFIAHNPGGEMEIGRVAGQSIPFDLFARANQIFPGQTGNVMAFRKRQA